MSDEKVLLETLASSDFKVSIYDKKRTDVEETKTVIENKQQFGEDIDPQVLKDKIDNKHSLLSIVKSMSTDKRRQIIELLKQNGLGDQLTKEKLIQNAFTVEKTIRDNV